jgi:TPR repeat protein
MEDARAKGAKWVNQAFASMYFNGDGVKADMRKAIDALSEDYLNGSRHAYAMMAALTAIGNASAKPDPSSARVYLDMAIQSGDRDARMYYDMFLKEGKWRFMEELTR